MIINCPVMAQDVKRAETIYGQCLGNLKGKTVRAPPKAVQTVGQQTFDVVAEEYRSVTLAMDVMKVNQHPFLVTISKHIRFGTVQALRNMQNNTILEGIQQVCEIYKAQGMRVTGVLANGQFESMRAGITSMDAILNVASPNEHVPEVERYICTIKERA
jgi:hypothetical protein